MWYEIQSKSIDMNEIEAVFKYTSTARMKPLDPFEITIRTKSGQAYTSGFSTEACRDLELTRLLGLVKDYKEQRRASV